VTMTLTFSMLFFVLKSRRYLEHENLKRKWGAIYEEFRVQSLAAIIFYPLFMFARIFLALVIVIPDESGILPVTVWLLFVLLNFSYSSIYESFNSGFMNVLNIFTEIAHLGHVGLLVEMKFQESSSSVGERT